MNIDIAQLARSLSARLFMNMLAACTGITVHTAVKATEVILAHQETYTAVDWIVAFHKACQLRLPERCESLPHRSQCDGDEYREAAQARNATMQCADGSWW